MTPLAPANSRQGMARGPPEQSSCCPHVPNHLCKAEQPACACLLQELIGHCSAVYSVNCAAALALEQHLSQYGYQQPADAVLEPESVQECMQEDTDSKRLCDAAGTDAKLHVHVLTALLRLCLPPCCSRPCRRVHRLHCTHPSGLLNPHLTGELSLSTCSGQ